MTMLSCENLAVRIADVKVVDQLNLELEPGAFWGVLGPNGIGKTTLLKCLSGLLPPLAGRVLLESQDLSELPRRQLARHIGMLQQHTVYVFDSRVLQTALTGRHPHLGYWDREGPKDVEKARSALRAVGLEAFAERSVTGLSGGEARRLAFAALLVQEPDIFLLDEPTNHLDLRHQVQIMTMIRNLAADSGHCALAALHDINLAATFCSHILMLFGDGDWCAGRSEDMLSESSLERLYQCPVVRVEGAQGPLFHPSAT